MRILMIGLVMLLVMGTSIAKAAGEAEEELLGMLAVAKMIGLFGAFKQMAGFQETT